MALNAMVHALAGREAGADVYSADVEPMRASPRAAPVVAS